VQITQNLSSRIRNAHAFELPSIYIPDYTADSCPIHNALEKTCEEMEQTIAQSVQNNLNNLERDCRLVASTIDDLLAADRQNRKFNRTAFCYGHCMFLAALHLPALALALLFARADFSWLQRLADAAPEPYEVLNSTANALLHDGGATGGLLSMHHFLFGTLVATVLLYLASRIVGRYKPYYSKREVANLQQTRAFVLGELLEKKARLYKTYFDQSVSDVQ